MAMTQTKPRLVGLNDIALEVGDIEEALRSVSHSPRHAA